MIVFSVESSELGFKKSVVRKKKYIARKALSSEEVQARSVIIATRLDTHLAELIRKKRILNRVVMVYSPINNEVDVGHWLKKGGEQFAKVVFPKVVTKTEMMVGQGKLVKGYQGILEPNELDEKLSDGRDFIDVVLVPGLAFRENKTNKVGRLGYGGGFYDRFIARIRQKRLDDKQPYLIGLFYENQREEKLPLEFHDIGLDCVITESKIYL